MEQDEEVISRLKFIGKLQKGEKINVKYMFVQSESIITSVSRYLIHQDNRQNTLNMVKDTIDKSFDIISLYSISDKKSQQQICTNIIQDLKSVKNGVKNLKETYIIDTKFCCDMDTILQGIDARLSEIKTDIKTEI